MEREGDVKAEGIVVDDTGGKEEADQHKVTGDGDLGGGTPTARHKYTTLNSYEQELEECDDIP